MRDNQPLPRMSVIIPSRNRQSLLVDAARSVLDGNLLPAEIIIVDQSDSSSTDLADLAQEHPERVRYVWSNSRGVSRARNLGIDLAQTEYLVFIDDDVIVQPTWFETIADTLLQALDDDPRSVVTGQVRPEHPNQRGGFAPSTRVDATPETFSGALSGDVLYSLNMALPRSAFDDIGRFDEKLGPGAAFPSGDDNDLGLRLLESGYRIVYVPDAVVYHRAWRAAPDYLPLRWTYGVGRGGFYAKHLRDRQAYILRRLTWDVRVHMLAAILGFRRQRLQALGDAALALGIVWGAARWLTSTARTR